jgi:hypothetical protein
MDIMGDFVSMQIIFLAISLNFDRIAELAKSPARRPGATKNLCRATKIS